MLFQIHLWTGPCFVNAWTPDCELVLITPKVKLEITDLFGGIYATSIHDLARG